MSMTMLTILQMTGIFALYSVITVGIPALFFHGKVRDRRALERFMVYFTIGNFYIMHIVFALELMHIANRITLITAAVGIAALAYIIKVLRKGKVSENEELNRVLERIIAGLTVLHKGLEGIIGFKTFVKMLFGSLYTQFGRLIRKIFSFVKNNLIETLLFATLAACLVWVYGQNYANLYGYAFSDLPVHNYWINAMDENNIFAAGVYPFGYHCIIFYMHKVFGIDTYVLLRVFGFTQTFYIYIMLLLFIKGICRSRYAAYAGCLVYAGYDIYNLECTRRYLGALPQEYGMLFILPAVYFAIKFFEVRKTEIDEGLLKKKWHVDSSWYLVGFALNFAMTIAVHFYDTVIAGIFCAGIMLGFAFRFFRPRYLGRIVVTVLAAVIIGALPMGIAVAQGKPLQGSIGWGINVILGKASQSSTTSSDVNKEADKEAQEEKETKAAADGNTGKAVAGSSEVAPAAGGNSGSSPAAGTKPSQNSNSGGNVGGNSSNSAGITALLTGAYKNIDAGLTANVLRFRIAYFLPAVLACAALAALTGILMLIFHRWRYVAGYNVTQYGAVLMSVAAMSVLMLVLVSLKRLGLPELMDYNRARVYYAYLLTILMSVIVDIPCVLLGGVFRKRWIANLLSLAAGVAVIALGFGYNLVRQPFTTSRLETNGAITCLTNIIHDNKDNTWTIVSANDELRMLYGHGYHYEPITFVHLRESKHDNRRITINTEYVYFYVEKRPLDYLHPYAGSGQMVSEEGAARSTPAGSGITVYYGENRWVIMSKMYYWAQKFMKLYPDEMTVYYEDDEFVCYRLKQNPYSLYNLAID